MKRTHTSKKYTLTWDVSLFCFHGLFRVYFLLVRLKRRVAGWVAGGCWGLLG